MSKNISDSLIVSAVPDLRIDYVSRDIRPTLGVRKAGQSGGGVIGTTLDPDTHREFGMDSNFERQAALQFRQRTDVAHVQDQPIRSYYIDRNGKRCETVWDLLITFTNGERELVSVKRVEVVQRPGFKENFDLMCAGVEPGIADRASLFTEHTRDEDLVDRGDLYHHALMRPKPAGADGALRFVKSLKASVKIQSICDFLRSNFAVDEDADLDALSNEFWIVVWLLAKRRLKLVSDGRLDIMSEVTAA